MSKYNGIVSRKIVVALALVAIMIGAGAYVFALGSNDGATKAPKDIVITQWPATSVNYRVYDMFQEPWGEWWPKRTAYYASDFIITDSRTDGWSTALFLPGRGGAYTNQGLIYAPYRYSIDADDLITIGIDDPEFMPVFGSVVPGAQATVEVYFQYIYQAWWDQYWIPTWGSYPGWPGDDWNVRSSADGYDLGTVYKVTMNREAAEEWMGIPQADDPLVWWAANGAAYNTAWKAWISNEGNVRLDIYCGYDWTYDRNGGNWMSLSVDGDGNVVLDIAELALGYEILMTRWLTEINLSPGLEVWYEDFSMLVTYGTASTDYASDAVAQYNLHAVKANGTADGAAWAWEPVHVDYTTKVGKKSDYKPYVPLLYTSWNSGDTLFSTPVPYEGTPWWFNLTAEETLTIELPTTTSPGFKGVGLTEDDYAAIAAGDNSAFLAIMDNGDLGLGYWITGWPNTNAVDLAPMYDPFTRTLTINGPHSFTNDLNTYDPPGPPPRYYVLYHGAPWIEFWIDNVGPTANAGPDQNDQVAGGPPVQFDGTGSLDNVRIYNYTWTFMHMGSPVTLYGSNPEFVFGAMGDYTVTLTVADSVGNTSLDTMIVHVTSLIPEFPTLVIPIAATLALIVVLKKRRR